MNSRVCFIVFRTPARFVTIWWCFVVFGGFPVNSRPEPLSASFMIRKGVSCLLRMHA